ncbi:MAG: TorF family putative porin, partial [Novosphingobium sp.]
MKIRLAAAVAPVALALLATPAFAQEETKPITVSGSAALVSDYRFRGVSQSDRAMAVQAGATIAHE